MEANIAVGTKIFTRIDKFEGLLESIPSWVSTMYVADDGEPSSKKSTLYEQRYPFELQILDLEYDAGLGKGREAILDVLSEDYLLIVDPDHRIPNTASILYDQLEKRPDLGGIAGILVEPEHQRLYCEAQDFREEQTGTGTRLVRGPDVNTTSKPIEMVAGAPIATFDFIPNVALLRKECLLDYSWDIEYDFGGEHIDFYVGHWKHTDWSFAVSPSVHFEHYPGGDAEYTVSRWDKLDSSQEHFLNKWEYQEDICNKWRWYGVGPEQDTSKNKLHRSIEIIQDEGLFALYLRTRQYIKNQMIR